MNDLKTLIQNSVKLKLAYLRFNEKHRIRDVVKSTLSNIELDSKAVRN